MRLRLLVPCLALAAPSLAGQAFVRVGAGATYSTDFVKDNAFGPIDSRQSLSPTGVVWLGWRLDNGYRVGVEGRYATGNWQVREDGTTSDVTGLATLGLALMADGPVTGALRWEVAVGQLRYSPERETGVFSRGGTSRWMLGGGVSWTRAVNPTLDLVLAARYDFHGFTTSRLEADGYSRSQTVHRGGLTLGLERGF